jgi:hypothetical protein
MGEEPMFVERRYRRGEMTTPKTIVTGNDCPNGVKGDACVAPTNVGCQGRRMRRPYERLCPRGAAFSFERPARAFCAISL